MTSSRLGALVIHLRSPLSPPPRTQSTDESETTHMPFKVSACNSKSWIYGRRRVPARGGNSRAQAGRQAGRQSPGRHTHASTCVCTREASRSRHAGTPASGEWARACAGRCRQATPTPAGGTSSRPRVWLEVFDQRLLFLTSDRNCGQRTSQASHSLSLCVVVTGPAGGVEALLEARAGRLPRLRLVKKLVKTGQTSTLIKQ